LPFSRTDPESGPLQDQAGAADFAHLTDTTARPRTPHPRHRTRFGRSSTLSCGSRPSRSKKYRVSSAVCEHAEQSSFTKSPGPRSSIRASYRGTTIVSGCSLFVLHKQHGRGARQPSFGITSPWRTTNHLCHDPIGPNSVCCGFSRLAATAWSAL
jgi:hypothetical protein